MSSSMPINLGPRYRCIRELGRGGTGTVYLVEDLHLEKELALKLLHNRAATAEETQAIQREFTLLAQLDHAGLARAHDFGYLEGRPFFTTECIDGESLGSLVQVEGVEDLLAIARALAATVAFLHQNDFLHLDIKPANVMLTRGRRHGTVLVDFGLCRRGTSMPSVEKVRGSLSYMAPEYFRSGELGPWTDVYALGVTLYRLATGSLPRVGAAGWNPEAGQEILWDPSPRPPSLLRPSLPVDLDHVLLRCLALDPAARYRSAAELLAPLDKLSRAPPEGEELPSAAVLTVGRDSDLARAERFLDARWRGEPGSTALLVTGLPGMGQSQFLNEIKQRAQKRGFHAYLETGYPGRWGAPGSVLSCLGAHMPKIGSRARARWEMFFARLRRPRGPTNGATPESERRLRRACELGIAVRSVENALLLVVDGLQFCDEVSVGLVIDLLRTLHEEKESVHVPWGVVIGFREEGPLVPLLRELTGQLVGLPRPEVITLGPLGVEETIDVYRRREGAVAEEMALRGVSAIDLFQRTGGCPRNIVALATCGAATPRGASADDAIGRNERGVLKLSVEERSIVLTLYVLGRPTQATEVSRLAGISRKRALRFLAELSKHGLLLEAAANGNPLAWITTARAEEFARGMQADEKRRLQRRIAVGLLGASADGDPAVLVEAVHLFRLAGPPAAFRRHARRAIRYLKSTGQNRAAMDLLRTLLGAIPPGRMDVRLGAALEMAEFHARVGEFDQGIRLLNDLRSRAGSLPPASRRRALMGLATLYSRRGDFRRADAHFQAGLRGAESPGAGLRREELLHFFNEHAAVKTFLGSYVQALELTQKGLDLARKSRSLATKEVALNLHATKANVALRRLDFEEARRDLEKALAIAEAMGTLVNKAVILNNLGIVHSQCDRYREAIGAFREAERTCRLLDEGPSLPLVHGNLAILHAKTGDFAASDRSLADGDRIPAVMRGQRQEFFLAHARGLSLLFRGRYAEAQQNLEASIRLAEAMGDRHLVAFDEVYRAESLLFQGCYAEAGRELSRTAGASGAERARRMALARLALLAAMTARRDLLQSSRAKYEFLSGERTAPFLDAWDDLFFGWAYSIDGDRERSRRFIDSSEAYFRRHALLPGLSLAVWVKAEGRLFGEDLSGVGEVLAGVPGPGSDLTRVLWPLLSARLLLAESGDSTREERVGDLLAEAGAALVGNPLPEWSLRLQALRMVLRPRDAKARAEMERHRRALSMEIKEDLRHGYLVGAHWRTWTAGLEKRCTPAGSRRRANASRSPVDAPSRSGTVPLPPAKIRGLLPQIVARSAGMREIVGLLDRVGRSELPVLITGETGAGKEIVARAIHEASRRPGPFLVVDCGAIPTGLFEAELFGVRAGAFTDVRADRPGVLFLAAKGTLLLDEIAAVGPEAQSKLLRVIAEGAARPLGAEREEKLETRFLFATSRDLEAEVRQGRFRRDLLHRLRVMTIRVPALRERHEDLPELTALFLRGAATEPPRIDAEAIEQLAAHRWPGNVRELKNLLLRLALENPRRIDARAVERALPDAPTTFLYPCEILGGHSLAVLKNRLERDHLVHHFRRLSGDTRAIERFLRLSSRQLYRRCARLGISLRRERLKLEGSMGRGNASQPLPSRRGLGAGADAARDLREGGPDAR